MASARRKGEENIRGEEVKKFEVVITWERDRRGRNSGEERIFSYANNLRCLYFFACGPLRGPPTKINFLRVSLKKPYVKVEVDFCRRDL